MKPRWPTDPRRRAAVGALIIAAVLALSSPFVRSLPPFPLFGSGPVFHVTTAADGGPGSLRAAILDADRAPGRARILVAVARITVTSPLPPLVNPHGITVESQSRVEIDGMGAEGAVLDIAAPGSLISNLRIVDSGIGIVVRAAGTSLRHVTLARCDVGVLIGEDSADLRIEQSSFIANRIGLQLGAHDGVVTVQGGGFERNRAAGIWAVSERRAPAAQLALLGNYFRGDGHGIVIAGLIADITGNSFEASDSDAIQATDTRVRVKGNRIRAALGFGIFLRGAGGHIEQNEVSNNCAGGIMLRDSANAQVERNQTYQNGHGIVVMAGSANAPALIVDNLVADNWGDGLALVGASAIVTANRVLRNHQIGLHVSAIEDERGQPTASGRLLLQQNTVSGNGREQHHDVFVLPSDSAAAASAPPGDCSWRHRPGGQLADRRALR